METIYVSSALESRYLSVFCRLRTKLQLAGVHFRVLPSTNIWLRDWMPIEVGKHFVKFDYAKNFARYPQLKICDSCWKHLVDVRHSPIVLDGGNVVRLNDRVLMTDIVFEHNQGVERTILLNELESLLEAEIIILPIEPGDTLGHADGIARWIDQDTVFINDYPKAAADPCMKEYSRALRKVLLHEGIEAIPFPNAYHRRPRMSEGEFRQAYPGGDEWNSGYGYSINFLQVANAIIYPVFGIPEDQCAECRLRQAFPGADLDTIGCSDLSMEGGLLNCITVNYRS